MGDLSQSLAVPRMPIGKIVFSVDGDIVVESGVAVDIPGPKEQRKLGHSHSELGGLEDGDWVAICHRPCSTSAKAKMITLFC